MKGIDGYDPIPVYSSLCYCFSFASGTLRGCGGYLPVRLFPAPAVAASAADPGRGVFGPDLRSRDGPPVHVPAMNTENSTDGFAPDRHAHKSPSPGFLTPTMFHHVRCLHPAKRFKDLAQIGPCHITGQITYTDIHSVPPFLRVEHWSLEDVLNRDNGLERRVLRRAMLSVTNDLASRLHQAIILSSEQHATDRHCTTLRRTSKVFYFFPPKYF